MIIGVPKEIKDNEYRVAMMPGGVKQLIHEGHEVWVQHGAGEGSGFTDEDFEKAGAKIVPDAAAAWAAEMVVKVKEPQPSEYGYLRPELTLFTYLHLAAEEELTKAMMEKLAVAKARVAAERDATTIAITRYGNVMASRGSVIPLFVDQIKTGKSLTVTDPHMTRFMMSIDEAVDLVLYAFQHGKPGDLFVQKAPAATIETLAMALKKIFDSDAPIEIIGIRHGEKQYETLLTREEMMRAQDLGGYYRVPADNRDLNYDLYYSQGAPPEIMPEDYNSNNTRQLSVDEMAKMLLRLDYIQWALHNGAEENGLI